MAINGAQLLRVTEWIIAVAVTLQTIELFQIRSTWNEKGIWTWRILRTEYPRALAAMLDPLLGGPRISRSPRTSPRSRTPISRIRKRGYVDFSHAFDGGDRGSLARHF